MSYWCSDLEKLVHPKEAGLGLLIVVDKRGPHFILEYRKDWRISIAEAGIQISCCPYCGSKLTVS